MRCYYAGKCKEYSADKNVCIGEPLEKWEYCDEFRAKVIVHANMQPVMEKAQFHTIKQSIEDVYRAIELAVPNRERNHVIKRKMRRC